MNSPDWAMNWAMTGLLPDYEIRNLALNEGMITPFREGTTGEGVISHGLTSAGYDITLDRTFWVYKGTGGVPVDPKKFRDPAYAAMMFDVINLSDHECFVLTPNCPVLAVSVETFDIPCDVKGFVSDKSTYARCFALGAMTPLEPGWKGRLTLELHTAAPNGVILYPGEGIAQITFFRLPSAPEKDYADRGARYQGQTGVTPARSTVGK